MASARLRWKLLGELDEWLDGPMAALSLVWLAIVVWELVSGTSALLETLGLAIWVIFLVEFAIRFALAPAKLPYLRRNWLTATALVLPALRVFRVLRAFRAMRGLRLVRIVGTANRSMNALRAALSRRGFGYVAALTLLVIGLGAAGMLNFEHAREVNGGLTSYAHALWWTGMLVASLGTDFWPQTTEGRVLAMLRPSAAWRCSATSLRRWPASSSAGTPRRSRDRSPAARTWLAWLRKSALSARAAVAGRPRAERVGTLAGGRRCPAPRARPRGAMAQRSDALEGQEAWLITDNRFWLGPARRRATQARSAGAHRRRKRSAA